MKSKDRTDRLVKKAFTHASSVNTLRWQKLSLWLSQHRFGGVLAEGTFSLANAEQHLRDKWYHGTCQSSATKVSFFMDNMFFDLLHGLLLHGLLLHGLLLHGLLPS